VISKLFATFTAKVAVVALAGGFATGGLAAAGAFTSAHVEPAGVAATSAVNLATSASGGAAKVSIGATTTATVGDVDEPKTTTTVKDPEEPKPTTTVTPKPDEPTSTVEADDHQEGDTDQADANDVDDDATSNHGNCVAFAASVLQKVGLTGEQIDAFMSLVARDKTAVTAKVAAGGTPDAACVAALLKAKTAALALPVTGTATGDGKHDDGQHHEEGQHHEGEGAVTTTATTTSAGKGDNKGDS
jgi:hypothetical protein